MNKDKEVHYLNTLQIIAARGDSIVTEVANKVITDWKDHLSLDEFKSELKDLEYLMESADNDELKELQKIYSITLKLSVSLK